MPHAHASGFPSPCVWLAERITPVGQDRPILTRSRSGDLELQRGAFHIFIIDVVNGSVSKDVYPFRRARGVLPNRR